MIWPGATFRYAGHAAEGLLKGRKVCRVTASGVDFSAAQRAAWDFQPGYLKHRLGFIGLTDVEHPRVAGMAHGRGAAGAAIASADEALPSLLKQATRPAAAPPVSMEAARRGSRCSASPDPRAGS